MEKRANMLPEDILDYYRGKVYRKKMTEKEALAEIEKRYGLIMEKLEW
jgi:hypothetical protein